jgi:acetyltransferase-like isoleucine patch superfamily enzyme
VGRKGFFNLLKYEIITILFQNMPGAAGIYFRNFFYPLILGKVGRGVSFGRGITLRHPHKITIDNDVVIDDCCVLDAKGLKNNGIRIKENVFIGRNSIIYCKDGDITLGRNTNIGFNSMIFSGSNVSLGENTILASFVYLIGGGHDYTRTDIPIAEQDKPSLGISVGDNCWLGAGAKVFDGISIGEDSIIGAGAVVIKDVPPFSIAAGMPARIIRKRNQ